MKTVVLNREEWGASIDLPRRGHPIGPARRTEVFIHHTVVVDSDSTINEWEQLGEVTARMQQLQAIRPDLGLDVPYSIVAFCMSNGDLLLCEGRGLYRTGAHTAGHNRSALGIAFQGNFQKRPLPKHLDSHLAALGNWLKELQRDQGFVNLGSVRPYGREVWGHRDVKATECPGQLLYDKLHLVRYADEDEMMMDKSTWKKVQKALQALDPPLYLGKPVDGMPGRNTNIALRAFERRTDLESRGVMGALDSPDAGIWPATRELLFAIAFAPRDVSK